LACAVSFGAESLSEARESKTALINAQLRIGKKFFKSIFSFAEMYKSKKKKTR
jgi:hypothetical protein